MDTKLFKKFIKQAVKEALQEEFRDILLEAVRTPKISPEEINMYARTTQPITETVLHKNITNTPKPNTREMYASLLTGMMESRNGNLSMNSTDAIGFGARQEYRPPASANTAAEGSSLPAGEVNLDQIMGLMSKK
jgi:hypothetical protein